nr:hypothetical protein [uncultured Mediterranean phage uvMED]
MNKFKGIEQKKTERKTKDWLDAKLKELPRVVKSFMEKNPTQDEIENFYTSYVMRYTKDSIEEIIDKDGHTYYGDEQERELEEIKKIETTAEIVTHFGNFFKPNK